MRFLLFRGNLSNSLFTFRTNGECVFVVLPDRLSRENLCVHVKDVAFAAAFRLLWNAGVADRRGRRLSAHRFLCAGRFHHWSRQRMGAIGGSAETGGAALGAFVQQPPAVAAGGSEEGEEDHRYLETDLSCCEEDGLSLTKIKGFICYISRSNS